MNKYRICTVLIILMIQVQARAHGSVDFLRSTGKIYAVVAVLVLIFLGLVYYLFNMDKRLSKLEQKITNNE